MLNDLEKKIKIEKENWDNIFKSELKKKNINQFSSFWWESYYNEITDYINDLMYKNNLKTVIESGSGSGKATILLDEGFKKTLLDMSNFALKYAKFLSKKFKINKINFINGNIFSLPFKENKFDFVWNIGVIEHYNTREINKILREMVRICKKKGMVAVGFPNFYSGPILKAFILKKMRIIPGYKLDTENFWSTEKIKCSFKSAFKGTNKKIDFIEVKYFGSPLLMETPVWMFKTFNKFLSNLLSKNKFLILVICKLK